RVRRGDRAAGDGDALLSRRAARADGTRCGEPRRIRRGSRRRRLSRRPSRAGTRIRRERDRALGAPPASARSRDASGGDGAARREPATAVRGDRRAHRATDELSLAARRGGRVGRIPKDPMNGPVPEPSASSSSLALHVEESGAGEPLLLMPGFSEGIPDLGEIHPELAKDYRVIAVALPGSGRSTPIPRAYTKGFYEDDAQTMANLLDVRGIRSALIAGFSDGGEVALLLAVRRPELVRAVVAWGASGVIPGTVGPMLDVMERVVDDPPERMAGW